MKSNPTALSIAVLLLSGPAVAEPWKDPRVGKQSIPYNKVAVAFATLKKQEGALINGDEERGFEITEADKRTQWLFTSGNQPAHPAVVRRIIRLSSEEPSEVSILCEKKSAACSQLLARYKTLDELSGAPVMGIAPKASSAK